MKFLINKTMEVFKKYNDLGGNYEVSNLGRIRSVSHKSKGNHGLKTHPSKILRPFKKKDGYWMVVLCFDGKRHNKLVHRLVAQVFLPNFKNYIAVNHKNGNKDDNRENNLEWCSYKQNAQHALKNNLFAVGEKCGSSKLTSAKIVEILKRLENKENGRSIGKIYGVSGATISRIKDGLIWKHIPRLQEILNQQEKI